VPISLPTSHEKRRVIAAVEGEVRLVDSLKTIGAIAAKSELVRETAEIFDRRVKAERPFRIFADAESASAWLDEVSSPVNATLAS
jgi:hypothetical protein